MQVTTDLFITSHKHSQTFSSHHTSIDNPFHHIIQATTVHLITDLRYHRPSHHSFTLRQTSPSHHTSIHKPFHHIIQATTVHLITDLRYDRPFHHTIQASTDHFTTPSKHPQTISSHHASNHSLSHHIPQISKLQGP